MKILISPFAARLVNGAPNPKQYPWWPRLVELLNKEGYRVIQIGVTGEERIDGTAEFIQNSPFEDLFVLVNDCATWISVDSWLPHFCNCKGLKRGIVLFGPSDPRIFGYRHNINLLRGRDFLRPHQYASWTEWHYDPNAFIYPENIMPHVYKLAPLLPRELLLTHNAVTARP